MRFAATVMFLLPATATLAACRPSHASSAAAFEHLPLDTGVPHHLTYAMLQDARGFLWFGTMYGLVKYDGLRWTVYRHDPADSASLSNDDVVSLCEDRAENLWVGTYGGGVNRLDRRTGRFTRFLPDASDPASLADGVVWAVAQDRGDTLWFATNGGGLASLAPGGRALRRWRHDPEDEGSLAADSVYALCVDASGSLWAGTSAGLDRRDAATGRFRHHRHDPAEPGSLCDDRVRALRVDRRGRLWAGTLGGGLDLLEGAAFRHYRNDPSDARSLSSDQVQAIAEDAGGTLWVGTARGLNRMLPGERGFERFLPSREDSRAIRGPSVIALCPDRSGVLWASAYMAGVDRLLLDERAFDVVAPGTRAGALAEDESGAVWIGSESGLAVWEPEAGGPRRVALPPELDGAAVRALSRDGAGGLWVGTTRGLLRRDGATGRWSGPWRHDPGNPGSLSGSQVNRLLLDRQGTLWVGTPRGLNRLGPGAKRVVRFTHDPADDRTIAADFVLSLYEDRGGGIWIGTYGGTDRLDPRDGSMRHFRQDARNGDAISSNYALSFHEDAGGRLWIGTGGGLNLYDPGDGSFRHWTAGSGLPNAVIASILAEEGGPLWLGTQRGLVRFDPRGGVLAQFVAEDGLQGNLFLDGAALRRSSGELLFGGLDGITRLDPRRLPVDRPPPPVAITGFSLPGAPTRAFDDPAFAPEVKLRHDESPFRVEFAALDFARPGRSRLSWQLEGVDPEWIDGGTRNEATYSGIRPGRWTFRVRAAGTDGTWGSAEARIVVHVSPPFWRSIPFYGASAGVLLLGMTFAHSRRVSARVRQVRAIEQARRVEGDRVRRRAADDFHDELGHRLTRIGLFSEIARQRIAEGSAEVPGYLERIAQEARSLSGDTREFLWSLDPEHDSLFDLAVRLGSFGNELFDRTGIEFALDGLADDLRDCRLGMETRRQLALIGKEALNNALRHARAGSVTLAVRRAGDEVALAVSDDGCGLGPAAPGEGRGLENLRRRAARIGGRLELAGGPGGGTTVRVACPREGTA